MTATNANMAIRETIQDNGHKKGQITNSNAVESMVFHFVAHKEHNSRNDQGAALSLLKAASIRTFWEHKSLKTQSPIWTMRTNNFTNSLPSPLAT